MASNANAHPNQDDTTRDRPMEAKRHQHDTHE